jgi:LysM repeat protein
MIGRVGGLALGVTLMAVVSSCGGTDGVAPTSTIAVLTTDFATIPPVQTTEPPPTVPPSTLPEPQEYVIVAGDNPSAIAQRFGVTLQALVTVNGWTNVSTQFPFPGQTILIPAGAKNPAYVTPDQTITTVAGEVTPESPAVDTGGTYVIEAGDFPVRIAEKFDVTLQALAAANGWENLSRDFPLPGAVINIPPKAG